MDAQLLLIKELLAENHQKGLYDMIIKYYHDQISSLVENEISPKMISRTIEMELQLDEGVSINYNSFYVALKRNFPPNEKSKEKPKPLKNTSDLVLKEKKSEESNDVDKIDLDITADSPEKKNIFE